MVATKAMQERKRGVAYQPEDIVDLVRKMYDEVGEPVTYHRFARWSGIPSYQIYVHYRSWYDVRIAAGLPRSAPNMRAIPVDQLLRQLHRIVLQLRRWPTMHEYQRLSKLTYQLLHRKIGPWKAVQERYREWVQNQPEYVKGPGRYDRNPQQIFTSKTHIPWMRQAWFNARVGFELKSSDFCGRSPGEAELLVVLDHDWPLCPVPVLEFSKVFSYLEPPRATEQELEAAAKASPGKDGKIDWSTSFSLPKPWPKT
jgi:hypothetical protein